MIPTPVCDSEHADVFPASSSQEMAENLVSSVRSIEGVDEFQDAFIIGTVSDGVAGASTDLAGSVRDSVSASLGK